MKIAIISDLHFGIRDLEFLEKQLSYFENIVFPYLLENKIKTVFQLGDTLHSRKFSLNQMLSEVATRYFHWFNKNKIKLYTLIGNHDSPLRDNSKFSPMFQYKSDYIIPIDKNKLLKLEDKTISMHSYYCNDFIEADIGLFHHDFIGKSMSKTSICENGIEFPDHLNYQKVYSGHYHSSKDEIYLKTPYQLSFEAFSDENGFIVLDLETMEQTFIENKVNQRFIKVYYYNKDNIIIKDKEELTFDIKDAIKNIGDNIVELNIENVDDKLLLDGFVENIKNVEYQYNNYFLSQEEVNKEKNNFVEGDFNNIEEMFDGFVDSIKDELPECIDKNLLQEDFLQIYRECNQNEK